VSLFQQRGFACHNISTPPSGKFARSQSSSRVKLEEIARNMSIYYRSPQSFPYLCSRKGKVPNPKTLPNLYMILLSIYKHFLPNCFFIHVIERYIVMRKTNQVSIRSSHGIFIMPQPRPFCMNLGCCYERQ
jgi:hypothetical protein